MYDAMSDAGSRLSAEEMSELAALADGTLPAERRPEVEARVAASAELAELLERQRQAVLAARSLADEAHGERGEWARLIDIAAKVGREQAVRHIRGRARAQA